MRYKIKLDNMKELKYVNMIQILNKFELDPY